MNQDREYAALTLGESASKVRVSFAEPSNREWYGERYGTRVSGVSPSASPEPRKDRVNALAVRLVFHHRTCAAVLFCGIRLLSGARQAFSQTVVRVP
jgi:hypothetical protein